MRRLLFLALAWLLPSLASAQYLVGGATNLLTDSDSISVGVTGGKWQIVAPVTVTQNYAAGPGSSGMVASRLQFGGYGQLGISQTYSLSASTTYDLSVYLTATSSGSTSGCNLQKHDNGTWTGFTLAFGTWTRVEIRATTDGTGALNFGGLIYNNVSSGTCDVLGYGGKLEAGTTATGSYPVAAPPDTYFWGGRWGFLRGASPSVSAPTIASFTASPASIASGGTSTLSWTLGGGTPTASAIDNGIGSVLGLITKDVSPTSTTTYTLSASNSGGSASATATVTVTSSGGSSGSWVSAAGTACTNGSALVPDANACEWQPCKDDPLPAVVYYVCSTGGDDSRTAAQAQSPSTPWATVAKAVAQFPNLNAGEAVAFCRGGTFTIPATIFSGTYYGPNWNNANGTQANPTIVRDYTQPGRAGMGDPRPIFNGEQFVGGTNPGAVKFENLALHASLANTAMVFYFGDYWDVTACNLEVSGASLGMQPAFKTSPLTTGRFTATGNRILNTTNQGVLVSGQAMAVTDGYFYNNGTNNSVFEHAIYFDGHSSGTESLASNNNLIARNEIHALSSSNQVSIVVHGIHNGMTIEDNTILYDVGTAPQATGWGIQVGPGYSDLEEYSNLTIRRNKIINPGNLGIAVAACKSNCLIENNLVVQTGQAGVGISAPNASNSFSVPDLNYTIRNNTVYMTVAGSTGIQSGAFGSGDVVANNAVQAPTCYQWQGASGAYTERDYNGCYVGSDTPIGAHSFTANPLWVNPTSASGFNFKPGTGSPLIGAGDSTQNPGIDLTGAARPTPPSIGAYEP